MGNILGSFGLPIAAAGRVSALNVYKKPVAVTKKEDKRFKLIHTYLKEWLQSDLETAARKTGDKLFLKTETS